MVSYELYVELIYILEQAKHYDQAIAVKKEFITMIERLTEPRTYQQL